ncbi:hypothetical protein APED_32455 [Acanthopleuribacter pedis]
MGKEQKKGSALKAHRCKPKVVNILRMPVPAMPCPRNALPQTAKNQGDASAQTVGKVKPCRISAHGWAPERSSRWPTMGKEQKKGSALKANRYKPKTSYACLSPQCPLANRQEPRGRKRANRQEPRGRKRANRWQGEALPDLSPWLGTGAKQPVANHGEGAKEGKCAEGAPVQAKGNQTLTHACPRITLTHACPRITSSPHHLCPRITSRKPPRTKGTQARKPLAR